MAARIGVILEAVHQVLNLVDMTTIGGRPATPLVTINRTQVAIFVSPFIPNGHLVVMQILDVRIALQEPQQFMDNRAQMKLFRGQARESLGQVIAALAAKNRAGSRTRTVRTIHPIFQNILE